MSKEKEIRYPPPKYIPADTDAAKKLIPALEEYAAWAFRFAEGGIEIAPIKGIAPEAAAQMYDAGTVEMFQARVNELWHVQYVVPRRSPRRPTPYFSSREDA